MLGIRLSSNFGIFSFLLRQRSYLGINSLHDEIFCKIYYLRTKERAACISDSPFYKESPPRQTRENVLIVKKLSYCTIIFVILTKTALRY